ncbi:MAG TPA: pallilysin-related adhesin, partial [Magnetospirillaceae bacterium]|nr:pallilysin-related adhesin [Magnetospirillaceae bacterium]
MKKATHVIFLLCSAAVVAYIGFLAVQRGYSRGRMNDKPMLARGVAAEPTASEGSETRSAEERARIASAVPPALNEILLDVYAFNLDSDREDEQVLVIRRTDDPTGVIRLVVADYISASRAWARAWEGYTAITKIQTLQILVKDVVGDHIPNIVAIGINDRGEQALSVFWRTSPARESRSPLYFLKICEVVGDSVLIVETDRPESYKLGQTNAEPWAVTVSYRDPESENILDQIQETWKWNFSRRAYERILTERIPGALIERRLATKILDGTVKTFERYIDGIWYKINQDPRAAGTPFVVFNSRDRTLSFFSDNVLEPYTWEDSHPTRYGIFIGSRSTAVRTLRRLIDVELTGHETVSIRLFQDMRLRADVTEQWNGVYRRMTPELAAAIRRRPPVDRTATVSVTGD